MIIRNEKTEKVAPDFLGVKLQCGGVENQITVFCTPSFS